MVEYASYEGDEEKKGFSKKLALNLTFKLNEKKQ